MSNTLIFLDVETTGLDPQNDFVLEIFAQAIDGKTFQPEGADPSLHVLINVGIEKVKLLCDHKVTEMHDKSGLFEDLAKRDGVGMIEAGPILEEYFNRYPNARLAGKNVGTFDRVVLESKWPGVTKKLSHQCLDVRTALMMFELWGNKEDRPTLPDFEGDKHRAKDDALHDMNCMSVIADWIDNAPSF